MSPPSAETWERPIPASPTLNLRSPGGEEEEGTGPGSGLGSSYELVVGVGVAGDQGSDNRLLGGFHPRRWE